MKLSKNFIIQEFVPPQIFNSFGDKSIYFIRTQQVKMCQGVRDIFGKSMTINSWHTGGQFTERGYRLPNTTTGGALSQHKLCNANDFNISGMPSAEVFDYMIRNQAKFLSLGISTLEHPDYATTWTHMDCRWTDLPFILIVKPTQATLSSGDIISMDEYFKWDGNKLVSF